MEGHQKKGKCEDCLVVSENGWWQKGTQNYIKEILGKVNRIHELREKNHCSYRGVKRKRKPMFDGSG